MSTTTRRTQAKPTTAKGHQLDSHLVNGGKELHEDHLPTMRDGSIKRVELHNFMTYDDCVFEPGPGLNLVLGPNGTGKSSIVSALCVGLAGNPRLLGRASKVKDYIKRGKTEAFTEITLHMSPPKRDIVIRRVFRQGSSSSEWQLNGRSASNEKVKETIEALNIQLDNLTQFLPQDRVCEFASLGPVDLLKQTEEAVLPPSVIQCHRDLVDLQKNFVNKNTTVEEFKKQIESLKKKNELLERDVEKLRERERILNKIEQLKMKLPFIRFGMKQTEGKQLREQLQVKEKELKAFESQGSPLDGKIKQIEEKKERISQKQRRQKEQSNQISDEFKNILSKLTDLSNVDENYRNKLKHLRSRQNQRLKDIQDIKKRIQDAEETLGRMQSVQDIDHQIRELQPQFDKINAQIDNYGNKRYEKKGEIEALQREYEGIKRKIMEFDNVKTQRLQAFRKMHVNDEVTAYEWIQQNRSKFEGNVYFLPLEISVKERLHAQFLENHCPRWLLQAFVCEKDTDRQLILREVVDRMKLNITVSYAGNVTNTLPPRIMDINELRPYGITHFLDETFDAPAIIKQIMNDNAQLFKVACGTDATRNTWEEMFQKTAVKQAFSSESRYTAKFSKYGDRSMSTAVIPLKPLRIFQGIDMSAKEKFVELAKQKSNQIRNYTNSLKEFEEAERSAQVEAEKVQAKKNQLTKERNAVIQQRKRIETMQAQLRRQEQDEDVEGEERRIHQRIADGSKKRIQYAVELSKKTKEATDLLLQQDRYPLERLVLDKKIEEYTMQKQDYEKKKRVLQTELSQFKAAFDRIREELSRLRDEVTESKTLYLERHPDMDDEEFAELLRSLPEDEIQIQDDIDILQRKANEIHEDPAVIEQYEARKREIEKKEADLTKHQYELENYNSVISDKKDTWLSSLEPCVAQINQTFTEYCKNIGISGEVSLGADETDFDKWSIQIKVKFRDNEELTTLSASRQSGGERSVTTMLYLLSLQQLNKCPFRVVDEINQGMDPQNERKIFYLMLDSSRGDDVPQSFLITPKLLPDLVPNHANNITILFIYNGLYNITQKDWDKFLGALSENEGTNGVMSDDDEEDDEDED